MSRSIADALIATLDTGRAMVSLPMSEQVAMRAIARRLAAMADAGTLPEDWAQIASCAEWAWQKRPEIARPMTVNGQWIAWEGGKCPVPPETKVEVRLHDKGVSEKIVNAGCWVWQHTPSFSNIVAYRIVD